MCVWIYQIVCVSLYFTHKLFETMAQVKFYLHKRGEQKTNLPVVLKYTFGKGHRFEYYTGLHANTSHYIAKYYTKQSGKPFKDGAPNAEYLNGESGQIDHLIPEQIDHL